MFESLVIERTHPLRATQLHALLAALPERVYRVKGVLHLTERPQMRCILQATGRRATVTIDRAWGDEPPASRLVFIAARGAMERALIERHLDQDAPERVETRTVLA